MSSHRIVLVVAVVFLIVAGFAVTTPAATPVAATTPAAAADVPPGVKPEMWQQLSPKLGIAVQVERGEGGTRQVHGTFMFKDGENWRPMILKEPSGVVPAR
ncbi:MAG TPA: hypothetical protein VGQ75_08060 [Thermoanaerobaculia bacterium]|jgi:hypothetical protein|nr:hypothetical protein [Thermoanaerobaculia bacterium]